MKEVKFKRIQCVDRAVDILNAVSTGNCHTINDIAKSVSLKSATVYNIVKTLASRGLIIDGHGSYEIGPKLCLLASSWDIVKSLPLLAQPILDEVNKKTEEAVCVAILVGTRAEIVNLMPGMRQVSAQFLHRIWNYPLNLGTGRLLIAMGNEADWPLHIEKQLQEGPKNRDERDWRVDKWRRHLEEIRRQGYVILRINPEQEGEELGAVAVPLRSTNNSIIAAIGCSCPISRATDAHLAFIKDTIFTALKNHPI